MSNIEQNGGQPSTRSTEQAEAAPPTDPRTTRNAPLIPETQRICRDFVWGICILNEHCKYRHELDYDSMKGILKFCHDFQNRTGCLRPDCTYLHTSREEENLFLQSGQIPRVLAERYASMSMTVPVAPAPVQIPAAQAVETGPVASFNAMNEYMAQPPLPPPLPSSNGPQPPLPPAPIPGPMTPTMSGQMTPAMNRSLPASMSMSMLPVNGHMMQPMTQMSGMMPVPRPMEQSVMPIQPQMSSTMPVAVAAPMPTILAPPPPPPPTVITTSTQMTGPAYSVPPPMQQKTPAVYPTSTCPLPQPPISIPANFDPSKPPPPLPGSSQARPLKRTASDAEAGPSKARKTDAPNDSFCENCIQRELRSELYRQESEKLQREDEYNRMLHDRTQEEFRKGRVLLRSLLRPEVYRILDSVFDSDELTPSTSNDLFSSSSSPPYNSSHSTVPRHILLHLMDYVFNTSTNNDHMPSIDTTSRRTNTESEVVASILELIRNSGLATENRVTTVESISSNGLNRFTNGQMENSSSPGMGPRYGSSMVRLSPLPSIPSIPSMPPMPSVPSTSSARYTVPVTVATVQTYHQPTRAYEPPMAPQAPPGPSQVPSGPPPPPTYMPYPSPVPPPPNRPYYQPYPGSNNTVAYTSTVPQAPRPSSSTAPAVNNQNYPQYMPRLPYNYYPPFQ